MSDSEYIPIFIRSSGMRVIVFGGGNVALRKCTFFKASEITVVSETVSEELRSIVSEVRICNIDTDAVRGSIEGYDLVLAATDDHDLNDMIRDIAISVGIPVNSAHGGGSVLIPSVLHRKDYDVAVSTQGKVPAFPPFMVDVLDLVLDESYDAMMELLIWIRPKLKDSVSLQSRRSEILAEILDDTSIWAHLRNDDMEGAKKTALKIGGIE